MRGDVYEAGDLVAAVRVGDGEVVQVPPAWLADGSPFAGTYVDAEQPAEPEPEAEPVESEPVKARPRRATDT